MASYSVMRNKVVGVDVRNEGETVSSASSIVFQ